MREALPDQWVSHMSAGASLFVCVFYAAWRPHLITLMMCEDLRTGHGWARQHANKTTQSLRPFGEAVACEIVAPAPSRVPMNRLALYLLRPPVSPPHHGQSRNRLAAVEALEGPTPESAGGRGAAPARMLIGAGRRRAAIAPHVSREERRHHVLRIPLVAVRPLMRARLRRLVDALAATMSAPNFRSRLEVSAGKRDEKHSKPRSRIAGKRPPCLPQRLSLASRNSARAPR